MAKILTAACLFALAVTGLGAALFLARPEAMRRMDGRWLSTHPLSSTGPFRGLLIDLWWIRAHDLEQRFEFDEVGRLSESISLLQPYIPEVWEKMAWSMGFNLLAESAPDRKKQVFWLEKAMRHLKTGLSYNPGSQNLRWYLGWLVFMKSRDGDESFSAELREMLGEEPMAYAYRQVRESDPIGRKVYIEAYFLAQLALQNGETENCRAYIRRMLEVFPDHGDALAPILENLEKKEKP